MTFKELLVNYNISSDSIRNPENFLRLFQNDHFKNDKDINKQTILEMLEKFSKVEDKKVIIKELLKIASQYPQSHCANLLHPSLLVEIAKIDSILFETIFTNNYALTRFIEDSTNFETYILAIAEKQFHSIYNFFIECSSIYINNNSTQTLANIGLLKSIFNKNKLNKIFLSRLIGYYELTDKNSKEYSMLPFIIHESKLLKEGDVQSQVLALSKSFLVARILLNNFVINFKLIINDDRNESNDSKVDYNLIKKILALHPQLSYIVVNNILSIIVDKKLNAINTSENYEKFFTIINELLPAIKKFASSEENDFYCKFCLAKLYFYGFIKIKQGREKAVEIAQSLVLNHKFFPAYELLYEIGDAYYSGRVNTGSHSENILFAKTIFDFLHQSTDFFSPSHLLSLSSSPSAILSSLKFGYNLMLAYQEQGAFIDAFMVLSTLKQPQPIEECFGGVTLEKQYCEDLNYFALAQCEHNDLLVAMLELTRNPELDEAYLFMVRTIISQLTQVQQAEEASPSISFPDAYQKLLIKSLARLLFSIVPVVPLKVVSSPLLFAEQQQSTEKNLLTMNDNLNNNNQSNQSANASNGLVSDSSLQDYIQCCSTIANQLLTIGEKHLAVALYQCILQVSKSGKYFEYAKNLIGMLQTEYLTCDPSLKEFGVQDKLVLKVYYSRKTLHILETICIALESEPLFTDFKKEMNLIMEELKSKPEFSNLKETMDLYEKSFGSAPKIIGFKEKMEWYEKSLGSNPEFINFKEEMNQKMEELKYHSEFSNVEEKMELYEDLEKKLKFVKALYEKYTEELDKKMNPPVLPEELKKGIQNYWLSKRKEPQTLQTPETSLNSLP